MPRRHVLIPLPDSGFDPTEAAVPWLALREARHEVVFATPSGTKPAADPRMVTGEGLGPLRAVLRADARGRAAYARLAEAVEFAAPLRYGDQRLSSAETWDALVLPGGHDKAMRPYLESERLQRLTADFFAREKPVAAICHGVIVVARSRDARTGRSLLWGRKTTSLLRSQELLAWRMTRLWLGDYYRTYPETVEDEVRASQQGTGEFRLGPRPLLRDAPGRLQRGFVVRDGAYVSARWPGDAHRFAAEIVRMLEERD
jgi:putative intracellular protease/amidase